jgi:hypothetical protein
VSWSEAAAHVGQSVALDGPVASASYRPDVSGQPTFVNLGRDYPDPTRAQLVVWGEHRAGFPGASPETMLHAGVRVCARGTLTSYNGVLEIIISSASEVTVIG